jgi:hypothetical protein
MQTRQKYKSDSKQLQGFVRSGVSLTVSISILVLSVGFGDSRPFVGVGGVDEPFRAAIPDGSTTGQRTWSQCAEPEVEFGMLADGAKSELVPMTCSDVEPMGAIGAVQPLEPTKQSALVDANNLHATAASAGTDGETEQKVPAWAIVLDAQPSRKIIKDETIWLRLVNTRMPWRVKDKVTGIVMLLVPPTAPDEAPFYMALSEMTHEEWVRLQLKKSGSLDKEAWLEAIRERKDSPSLLEPGFIWREAYKYYSPADRKLFPIEKSIFGGTFEHPDELLSFILEDMRKMPMDSLSREGILATISKCGFRLPTHAQWVRALLPESIHSFETMVRYQEKARVEIKAVGKMEVRKGKIVDTVVTDSVRYLPSGVLLPRNALGFSNLYGNMWELLDDGRVIGGACDSTERACRDLEPRSPSGRWIGARLVKDP